MLAEFGTGQVFWSFLWFFIFIIWIYLLIFIFSDIFRSRDLSGWGKALWSIFIIFLPYLGIFVYLIVRGAQHGRPSDRAGAGTAGGDGLLHPNDREFAPPSADQLAQLAELHTSGKLDDAEYAAAKAKVLQG